MVQSLTPVTPGIPLFLLELAQDKWSSAGTKLESTLKSELRLEFSVLPTLPMDHEVLAPSLPTQILSSSSRELNDQ